MRLAKNESDRVVDLLKYKKHHAPIKRNQCIFRRSSQTFYM